MVRAVRGIAGNPAIKARRMPWGLMGLLAPFNETVREMMEIRPLWRMPIQLDNARLIAFLGAEPATPLEQAVQATLRGMGCLPPEPARPIGHRPALQAET